MMLAVRIVIYATVGCLVAVAVSLASDRADAKPSQLATLTLTTPDPHLGGTVTFALSETRVKQVRVDVTCTQAGVVVWAANSDPAEAVLLGGGSSDWLTNGGAANCTAVARTYWRQSGAAVSNVVTFTAGGAP